MTDDTTRNDSFAHGTYAQIVRRPVAVIMVVCLVVVFGMVSYQRLALTLMPDISYPTITVRTEYPGAAPEEVETVVSRRMEQALGVVSHLERMSSISRAELSDVILEFSWGTDMSEAAQDVREKLERVGLPDEVERPLILRYDPALDPIMRVALYGDEDLFSMRRVAEDQIKRALDGMEGVAAVKVRGGLEQEILVEVRESQLAALNMSINEVVTRLQQENINLSGGQLREGLTEYMVRTLNEFRDLDEIRQLVIREREGVPIRLQDIARVTSTNKEREVVTRISGTESVEIEIYKEGDANIVDVAEAVFNRLFGTEAQRAWMAQQQAAAAADSTGAAARRAPQVSALGNFVGNQLPPGMNMVLLSDQSKFIKASLQEVASSALLGGIMAVIILFLFLRKLSNTLIVAVAIPVSIVATFAGMYLGDVSLNIMSLGGLALGVGMMVDNSIVVLESIFRCREEGDDIITAAVRGTSEVGGAVTASTLTTIAVFFPIVFVEGVAGQVFGDLSLAVVFSLLASLAVALWFIPMLASRQLSPESSGGEMVSRLAGSHLMRFWAVDNAKKLAEDIRSNGGPLSAVKDVVLLILHIPLILVEVVVRAVVLLVTVAIVLVRAILALVLPLLWPIGAPLTRYVLKRETPYATGIAAWVGKETWWKFYELTGRIWPPLLKFNAAESFRVGIGSGAAWMWQGKWWHKALRFVPGIVRFALVFIRFAVHALLEPIGKLFIMFFLFLALLVVGFFSVFGLVLLPLFALMSKVFEAIYSVVAAVYPKMIRWALSFRTVDGKYRGNDNRLVVAGGAALLLAATVFYIVPGLGQELIPQVHQGEFFVDLTMPVGTPITATERIVHRVETLAEGIDGVVQVASSVGAEKSASTESDQGENTGRVTVIIESRGDLEAEEARVMDILREQIHRDIARVDMAMSLPTLFSFKTPVEVEIKGYNLDRLKSLSFEVRDRLSALPGFEDVESSIQPGNPEVLITYDRRRLSEMNLTPRQVAEMIRTKVHGTVATQFREEDMTEGQERRIDIRVQVDREDKEYVSDLRRLVINPGQSVPIPLAAVADVHTVTGPSEIRRIAQQRAAVVSANLNGMDLGTATEAIHASMREMNWPSDFSYMMGGQNEEMQKSLNSLYFALLLAVFLVYVVMASQFESFLHPFVILFSIPLALVGVALVLWALDTPISVVVFLGLIILAGIVVNNAIVLVDYVNKLRKRGMEKTEALIEAGNVRLRPILMTTLTTVLGLIPMAIGLGEGAEIRTPMAITVIAGLLSSTLLTLVVVPVVYSLLDRKK